MVKVDVISGFLGAGKTTLIKKMFESDIAKEQVVIIENEFGEIGIDGTFLKGAGVQIKEINSGCICCSLVGDFESSIKEIIDRFHPDRIIIEPSGVGKLSDIVKAILKVDADLKLNIVVTVVDGGKCKMYIKNFGEFYIDQVKEAHNVVISKADILPQEKVMNAYNQIREINPTCSIITTPITELSGEKLVETLEEGASGLDSFIEKLKSAHEDEHEHHHHDDDEECCCHHHHHHDDEDEHEHHHHHEGHHHADEVFSSWGTETTKSYSHDELTAILDELCKETYGVILRAKGVVKASDAKDWYYFDLVYGDYEIRTGDPDVIGKVCVIGSKIDEKSIQNLF